MRVVLRAVTHQITQIIAQEFNKSSLKHINQYIIYELMSSHNCSINVIAGLRCLSSKIVPAKFKSQAVSSAPSGI